jgi:hypothetical protein
MIGLRWRTDGRPARHGWGARRVHEQLPGPGCKDLEDKTFIEAKRAMMCADCASALPDPAPQPKPESTADILLKLPDAIQDINAMIQVPSSHTLKRRRSA